MHWQKIRYVIGGLKRRGRQPRRCPSCHSHVARRVDRKGFHDLLRCINCSLLYRWPYETAAEMARFYQRNYQQTGLTTDLPDETALNQLMAAQFRGTAKDFSRVIELLGVLNIPRGARVLDFGANWGYGVWQLQQAGYAAVGYELSRPRASYSRKLGVEVLADWDAVETRAPFDVVFSSHVLEHTPDPAQALRQKLAVLAPDGWLIAFFPNGSEVFQKSDPSAFHRIWGQVHPVLLDEKFVRNILPGPALVVGAHCADDIEGLKRWDRKTARVGTLNTSEMLVIWNRS